MTGDFLGGEKFQSAPGFSAGRNRRPRIASGQDSRFNPLPAFRPGETCYRLAAQNPMRVSIRSRLFGREKLIAEQLKGLGVEFQSAPGFSAGRNFRAVRPGITSSRFNPLPAFRPGETGRTVGPQDVEGVSIRSRLFGREKPYLRPPTAHQQDVSIRSRLFGREKQIPRNCSGTLSMVSIRSRLFGREKRREEAAGVADDVVSIRSRLFGREKLTHKPVPETLVEFQSAPGFSAGRNRIGASIPAGC